MKPESLLAFKGDVLVSTEANDTYNVLCLIRVQKIQNGTLPYDRDYDFNGDGVVDDKDKTTMQKILLMGDGIFSPDYVKY